MTFLCRFTLYGRSPFLKVNRSLVVSPLFYNGRIPARLYLFFVISDFPGIRGVERRRNGRKPWKSETAGALFL
jgi:hypothetical protein